MLQSRATALVPQSVVLTVVLTVCAFGLSPAAAAPPRLIDGNEPIVAKRKIVVRSPLMLKDARHGRLIVEPNVEFTTSHEPETSPSTPAFDADIGQARFNEIFRRYRTASHSPTAGTLAPPVTDPLFEQVVDDPIVPASAIEECDECNGRHRFFRCDKCSPFRQLFAFDLFKTSTDVGIGQERVMHAIFALDRTEPLNNVLIRYDSYRGMAFPDRAEYFWASTATGPPLPETRLDYQDLLFSMETGGDRFSMVTEIPIRMLDPVNNGNTAGLGDISFGPKAVLVKGKRWQLAHIFRTFLSTGSTLKGLGTGHVSLEPGLLIRYKWTPRTFLHGELKYRFPIGADPMFSGQVLRYGFGAATVLYETDTFAMLPTMEFVGWSVLDGRKTLPSGLVADVDGEMFFSVQPGLRFVLGPKGDLGLFEFGISGAANLSNNGFFDNVSTANVLELGCAAGGNLIPMAVSLPEASFYGIDLSKRQLEDGWKQIEQIGLTNIELAHRSILDIADDEGPFDYIICHGVYSWVAREIQDKIFEICEKNLTEQGVAYISYNTHPGWFLRGMVRRMMCFHARQFDDPQTQVQQARALLDFLINAGVVGDETYHTLLRRELEIIRGRQDSYLFHEHLEDVNEPEFFYEFIERAEKCSLRYLAEAQFSEMVPANYGANIDTTLRELGAGLIHTEQYLDFLRNRTFRRTLLCHKKVELNRQLGHEQLRSLRIASRLRATDENADLSTHRELSFQDGNGAVLTVAKPLLKAALAGLARVWPEAIPFDSIPALANREFGRTMVRDAKGLAEDLESLGGLFLEMYTKDLVTIRANSQRFATRVSPQPVASSLARLQAEEGEYVTSLNNSTCRLDDLGRRVIRLLDGTNNIAAIRSVLREAIEAGEIVVGGFEQEGDTNVSDEFLDELLQNKLDELAGAALLISHGIVCFRVADHRQVAAIMTTDFDDTEFNEETPHRNPASPLPLALSAAALALSIFAVAWVLLKPNSGMGKGLSAYDFSSPENALKSELQIERDGDLRARIDLTLMSRRKRLNEQIETLSVEKTLDFDRSKADADRKNKDPNAAPRYAGYDPVCKVAFVKYEREGKTRYDVDYFQKHLESGYWMKTYESARRMPDDLQKQIREWQRKDYQNTQVEMKGSPAKR
eukprot:g26693.t1